MMSQSPKVLSTRPYMIKAMLHWIEDNNMTPYVIVRADMPQVMVPEEFVQEGRIVLNINPEAIRHFLLSSQVMMFRANFSGERHNIYIPLNAIEVIYAHETGQGINLDELDPNPPQAPTAEESEKQQPFSFGVAPNIPKTKPKLTVLNLVKPDQAAADEDKD